MNYNLIKIIDKELTPIERVLTNRGIDLSEVEHYLDTTDDDIFSPDLLNNMREGAQMLIKNISNNVDTQICVDPDVDGFSSAALLINYLYKLFPAYVLTHLTYKLQEGKEHGIIPERISENIKFVIAPDSSSNSVIECAEMASRGADVLILDHHEVDTPATTACIINNQFDDYPNKSLSGVGIVYKFCSYIDELLNINYAENFLDLVALGCIADMVSLKEFETAHLVRKGISNVQNCFFSQMVKAQEYSLKNELTPFGVAFYIAPYINATIRVGTQEDKMLLFEAMLDFKGTELIPSTKRGCKGQMETRVEQACRNCNNIKNKQTKIRDENLEIIKSFISEENLLENKILTIPLNSEMTMDKNLTGLIANQLMAEYKKPVLLLNQSEKENEIIYEGSARNVGHSDFSNFRDFMAGNPYVEYAQGHQSAFGVGINKKYLFDFINDANEKLKAYSFSNNYDVDFIYNAKEIKSKDILDIAELKSYWGQGVEEPLIAIERINITSDNIKLMSPDKNPTLKIILPNGISLIKFKSSLEEYERLKPENGYITLTAIGRCEENIWNGNISPQILIEDYEVESEYNYYF